MTRPGCFEGRALAELPGIRHGFFTRRGGVSQGLYQSLNCGWGTREDALANVIENRRRVGQALGVAEDRLLTPYQVHGVEVFEVREPWPRGQAPRVDVLVTRQRGVAVGVLSADCVPVLFADANRGVVAAAHAGWRGALAGVVEAALRRMTELGSRIGEVRAVVGPAISAGAYEVGAEFEREFATRDTESARFFTRLSPGSKPRFDLPGYVRHRLEIAGVREFEVLSRCTCTDEVNFFSHRRQTLRGESDYGRQISAIAFV